MKILKQLAIVAVASIVIIATVNFLYKEEANVVACSARVPHSLMPEADIPTVDLEQLLHEINCSEFVNMSVVQLEKIDGALTEIFCWDMQFNNNTGNYHVNIITDTYSAEAWCNYDNLDGFVTVTDTVSDQECRWVKVSDVDASLVDSLFAGITYDAAISSIRSLLTELFQETEIPYELENEWYASAICSIGTITAQRHDDTIVIVYSRASSSGSRIELSMKKNVTEVPLACYTLQSPHQTLLDMVDSFEED